MRKNFRFLITLVTAFLSGWLTGGATSPNEASGTVSDTDGEPLIGAFVVVKGTTSGTSTDIDGKYRLSATPGSTLVFSYIGFEDKELVWNGEANLDVSLGASATYLEDVVVIGYGTVKKKDLTGAVGNVSGATLEKATVPDVGGALQGQVAGLQVVSTGKPGDNVSLKVRGVGSINGSEPLVVIDGVPSSVNLNSLNMADVESVDVLKDASSCAIYGSRGAYGVVLITTKKGKAGSSKVDIRANFSIQQIARKMKLLNARQFASLHNEMMLNGQMDQYDGYVDPTLLGEGTDWQSQLYQTGFMQDYNLSWAGGGEVYKYYISAEWMDQKGVIKNTRYDRITLQFNGEADVKKWLKFGHNITLNNDTKSQGDYNIGDVLAALPNIPLKHEDGTWAGPSGNSMYLGEVINPIGRNELNTQKTIGYNMLGNIYGELKPWDFLRFRSTIAVQLMIWNQDNWTQAYDWEPVPTEQSNRYQYHNNVLEWMWDNILTFDKDFGKHHVNAIAGISMTENTNRNFGGSIETFISDSAREINNGITNPLIYGTRTDWALFSFIARANYVYDERYFITATYRRDGSSRFSKKNRWGNFPSVSLAWKASNEAFFPKTDAVSELKVRAGYGLTGNQTNVGAYGSANSLSSVRYVFNNILVGGFAPSVMANPDVTWEEVQQYNIGVDMGFLKSRIALSLDAYVKDTRNMLVPMSVPISTGYSDIYVPQINAGSMRNVGVELALTTHNIMTKDWDWSTTVIASWNRNRITALNGNVPIYGGNLGLNMTTTINAVGHPAGSFYGYVTDGIFQTPTEVETSAIQVEGGTAPGDIRFKDLNSDGVIDANDRTFLGDPTPKWQFSMNNSVRWKELELTLFLQGVADCQIFNITRMNLESMSVARNQSISVLNRWRGAGSSDTMPRAVYGDPNNNARPSDRFIEDGSYLRLKNLQLAYSLPGNITEKMKIQGLKFFVSAQNLFTLTRYKGVDPEVGASGLDNNIYPLTRTYSFGINLTF
ncbi:MAG: TonB-dependent receptor [Bacteroidales bacterium]|nr:TonB-dependent receptor [Bacteroidales bacterium]